MIYVAADLHLRERTWKGHPEISGDQYNAWAQLCITASKDPEGVVVLAGDIFDTPYPTGLDEAAFRMGIEMLKNKGLPCYFNPGNHDTEQDPRPCLFGALELSENEPNKLPCGFSIAGIPFTRSTAALHEKLANIPAVDMLVMHTGFRHLLGFEETWQVSIDDIPEQVGMVMAGHVHVHSESEKVYSPGSLALHRADEIDKGHGYFVVDPRTSEVTWKEVATRRYVSVNIDKGVDQDALGALAACPDYNRPVVMLTYRNEDTAKAEALQELWKDKLLFVCNARSGETMRAIEETVDDAVDIDAVVHDWLSGNLTREQFELAESLLETQDPPGELNDILTRNKL